MNPGGCEESSAMRKITVFIVGDGKERQLDERILVNGNSCLLLKTATVFWNYNNVFAGFNDRFTGYRGRVTQRATGYSKCLQMN